MPWQAGFFTFLLGIGILPSVSASERLYIDSTHTALLISAQTAILNDQFDSADSIAAQLTALSPSDPAGKITRAASMLARMSDGEEDLYERDFPALLDSISQVCQSQLDSSSRERKAWLYLFMGHAQAYRSLYESKFGSSFAAIRMGLRTKSSYSAGLEQDSGLVDLYFGLGSYHYWKSVKAGLFRWLGLFHNDIERGIAELHCAADSSLLSRDVANSELAWVFLDREEYDSVIAITEPLRERYRTGKSFLWPLAKAMFAKRDYAGAYSVYRDLRERIEKSPGNYFNLIECDYLLAQCREKGADRTTSAAEALKLDDYEKVIPESTRQRQSDKIRYLRKLIDAYEATASTE